MQPERYSYDRSFQERILTLMLRDPSFVTDYGDALDASYFDYEALVVLSRLTLTFQEQHGEIPVYDSLVEQLRDYCKSYQVSDRIREEIEEVVTRIYKGDLRNAEPIKSRAVKFGKRQALKAAVYEIADMVQHDKEYDNAETLIRSALRVGHRNQESIFHLGTDLLSLPRLAQNSSYSSTQKIPTLWPTFDRYTHGGPARKEVWIVAALSGVGKSTCLVQLGVSGLVSGFGVAHFTIGDLTDVDVGLRYGSRVTGCTIPQIIKNEPIFQQRAANVAGFQGELYVKHYPSGTASMADIASCLSYLKHFKNFSPGIVIIDYPDELKFEDMYMDLGAIYGEIQALGHEYNSLMIVASQVERYAPKTIHEVIRMSHLDHSKLKYTKCDGMFSLNQTLAERRAGRARIWVDKTRRYGSNYLIEMQVDYTVSAMREIRELNYQEPEKPQQDARRS